MYDVALSLSLCCRRMSQSLVVPSVFVVSGHHHIRIVCGGQQHKDAVKGVAQIVELDLLIRLVEQETPQHRKDKDVSWV